MGISPNRVDELVQLARPIVLEGRGGRRQMEVIVGKLGHCLQSLEKLRPLMRPFYSFLSATAGRARPRRRARVRCASRTLL